MRLTPTEMDRLTLFSAAELSRRRKAKGLRLTHPEAVALICDEMHEAARAGGSYEEVQAAARSQLTMSGVLDGVPELVGSVRVECLFDDGMRLVTVSNPIAPDEAKGTK